jgi:hypothetical protein
LPRNGTGVGCSSALDRELTQERMEQGVPRRKWNRGCPGENGTGGAQERMERETGTYLGYVCPGMEQGMAQEGSSQEWIIGG